MYRLQHRLIGRSKHASGSAQAHLRYILRPSAATWTYIHVPLGVEPTRDGVSLWMHQEEREDRKDARLLDTLTVSLPRSLRGVARYRLMTRYIERVTEDRIPVIAAVHDSYEADDAFNPHGHIALRDRAFGTGKRVLRTSSYTGGATAETVGSTIWLRALWEEEVNRALAADGSYMRVDRRSKYARGIGERPRPFVARGTWNRLVKRPAA